MLMLTWSVFARGVWNHSLKCIVGTVLMMGHSIRICEMYICLEAKRNTQGTCGKRRQTSPGEENERNRECINGYNSPPFSEAELGTEQTTRRAPYYVMTYINVYNCAFAQSSLSHGTA